MKFTVLAVGKLKERFWEAACAEYLKRLSGYARVNVIEVPDVAFEVAGSTEAVRAREAKALLPKISPDQYVVLLDVQGKQLTSVEFSQHLSQQMLLGKSDFVFVLGGPEGVSPEVRSRANLVFSFGNITLPHNLARVVLLEQLYRAMRISRGEKYHK